MAKKKEPQSWADRLNPVALAAPGSPDAVEPHHDPLLKMVAETNAELSQPGPKNPTIMGLDAQLKEFEHLELKKRCWELEIRNKELEMGLHLAKAKICEYELEKLKKGS